LTSFESSKIKDAIIEYKGRRGGDVLLINKLNEILNSDPSEIGTKLSESTDIIPASKLGIMLILNSKFIN
jgi:hypothetical protein